jgi:hypothetical protein
MIYMHNRIVSINTMGTNTPDLTPEFCEALGRAIMWGLPDQTAGTDTIDSVNVFLEQKEALVRFSGVISESNTDGCRPLQLNYNVRESLLPIEKDTRLVMGVVQHSDGTWSLNT